jgi:hypothetical protein
MWSVADDADCRSWYHRRWTAPTPTMGKAMPEDAKQEPGDHTLDPTIIVERETEDLIARAVFVPTPAILRPAFAPRFERCVVCDTDLVAHELGYLVFKEMRGDEVLVEMAICTECLDVLVQVYSPQTRRAIDGLFVASDWFDRARERLDADPATWPRWLDRCALTGQPREAFDHYEVIGICAGEFTQVSLFPYVIGTDGIRLMEARISRQSQANWDRFLGQHQGLPPELRQLLHVDGN